MHFLEACHGRNATCIFRVAGPRVMKRDKTGLLSTVVLIHTKGAYITLGRLEGVGGVLGVTEVGFLGRGKWPGHWKFLEGSGV